VYLYRRKPCHLICVDESFIVGLSDMYNSCIVLHSQNSALWNKKNFLMIQMKIRDSLLEKQTRSYRGSDFNVKIFSIFLIVIWQMRLYICERSTQRLKFDVKQFQKIWKIPSCGRISSSCQAKSTWLECLMRPNYQRKKLIIICNGTHFPSNHTKT